MTNINVTYAHDVPYAESHGAPLIAYEWILFALTTPFVLARFDVQLRFRSRPWRELLVLQALAAYFIYTVCDSLNNGQSWFNYSLDFSGVTDAEMKPVLTAQFITWVMFPFVVYGCKGALLFLYMDITPKMYFPRTWWAIIITWGCVIVAFLNHVFYEFFQYVPFEHNTVWSLYINGGEPYLSTPLSNYFWPAFTWATHLLTDLQVYLIPIAIMRNIEQMTLKDRQRCYALFALGFFNIVSALAVSFTNFGWEVFQNISLSSYNAYYVANTYLTPFQMGTAIMIVCAPACSRLWRGVKANDLRPGIEEDIANAKAAIGAPPTVDVSSGLEGPKNAAPRSPASSAKTDAMIQVNTKEDV